MTFCVISFYYMYILLYVCQYLCGNKKSYLEKEKKTKSDVPTLISIVNQVQSAADERLANKAWSKCCIKNDEEHEYKKELRLVLMLIPL